MAEGDFLPPSRPIRLTRAQLLEMEKRFAETDDRVNEVRRLEGKHREKNIENPKWM